MISGCHLYQERRREFSLLHIQTKHLHLTCASLLDIKEEADPFMCALANHFMALICYYTHALRHGERYRRRVMEIIQRNNIRFVPSSDTGDIGSGILEYSEEVHERAAFLAEQIYTETDIHMIIGYREELCGDVEQQFRFELPVGRCGTCHL